MRGSLLSASPPISSLTARSLLLIKPDLGLAK
jgi:hypothetical protein